MTKYQKELLYKVIHGPIDTNKIVPLHYVDQPLVDELCKVISELHNYVYELRYECNRFLEKCKDGRAQSKDSKAGFEKVMEYTKDYDGQIV